MDGTSQIGICMLAHLKLRNVMRWITAGELK